MRQNGLGWKVPLETTDTQDGLGWKGPGRSQNPQHGWVGGIPLPQSPTAAVPSDGTQCNGHKAKPGESDRKVRVVGAAQSSTPHPQGGHTEPPTHLSSRLPLGDAEGLDWASSVTSEMMGPELVDESGE